MRKSGMFPAMMGSLLVSCGPAVQVTKGTSSDSKDELGITSSGRSPVGLVDYARCNADGITGWAYDPDLPTSNMKIDLYLDGPAGQGLLLGTTYTAHATPTLGGNFRFKFDFKNAAKGVRGRRKLWIYALDETANDPQNPTLKNGPTLLKADPSAMESATMECPFGPGDGELATTIFGKPFRLVTSARIGGAIDSMEWNGRQLVNSADKGRSFQTAWTIDGRGECLNPTEGGHRVPNGTPEEIHRYILSPSATKFLDEGGFSVTESSITSRVHPAYWLRSAVREKDGSVKVPAESSNLCGSGTPGAVNETDVAEHVLEKTLQLKAHGIENAIAYKIRITDPFAFSARRLEIISGHMLGFLDKIYKFDPTSGTATQVPDNLAPSAATDIVLNAQTETPVFATNSAANGLAEGEFAVGIYGIPRSSEEKMNYHLLRFQNFNNPGASDYMRSLTKLSLMSNRGALAPGETTYQGYIFVGNREQVLAGIKALHEKTGSVAVHRISQGSNSSLLGKRSPADASGFPPSPLDTSTGSSATLSAVGNRMVLDARGPQQGDKGALVAYAHPAVTVPEGSTVELNLDAFAFEALGASRGRLVLKGNGNTAYLVIDEGMSTAVLGTKKRPWLEVGHTEGKPRGEKTSYAILYVSAESRIEFYRDGKLVLSANEMNLGNALSASFEVSMPPQGVAKVSFKELRFQRVGHGRITSPNVGISCGSDCLAISGRDTVVRLMASPDAQSAFAGWSGCDVADGSECQVAGSKRANVFATFKLK